ncbi:MAG: formate dehydrogenase subunit gamma [Marinosulfonomonas sp.]|nr:formate dehydrogenase subunit gamma [Marinosulfonomonas sp.]
MAFSFLLAAWMLLVSGHIVLAQSGGQTLEDILARQNGEVVINNDTSFRPPETGPLGPLGGSSDADFWRALRGAAPTDVFAAPTETQLMTRSSQLWRMLRENVIRKYLGWLPLGVIAILAIFHIIKGPMRISGGRSGKMLPRFSLNARVAHWFMAAVFIILGVTGLLILVGRSIIAPYLGLNINSIITSAAMQAHNLFGPIFVFALGWLFVRFVRGNFFRMIDLKWILKLGGFFGGHVSSGQFNFGEKSWFWMVILVGLVISATGLLMLFPWVVDDIRILQLSTVLHALGGVGLVAVSIGHIYVGTIGMEGSLDSMLKGEVDENWAKEHHDVWYEEITGKSATEDKP